MDKIFEILGIERLDEAKQVELKETLKTIIDIKSSEIAESKVESLLGDAKTTLKEEYETKFNDYKDTITTKFSNFVDNVLDEEMIIPENVIKFARQGELYHELIEQFKVRLAIDEGMISKEVREMLKEAKDEIVSLREKLDEAKGIELTLEKDASEMAAQIYIQEKCEGLSMSQRKHVTKLLADELVKESIDKKFDIISKSIGLIKEEEEEVSNEVYEMECPECGNKESVKEKLNEMDCPECGASMKPAEVVKESKSKEKQSKLNEDATPWETYKNTWLKSIKGTSE